MRIPVAKSASYSKVISFGGNPFFRKRVDGISRYAYNFLDEIARRNPQWLFLIVGFQEDVKHEDSLPKHDNVKAVFVPLNRRLYEARSLFRPKAIDHYLPEKPDFHIIPELYALPHLASATTIVIVHDLVFRDVPETSTWKNNLNLLRSTPRTLKQASVIACVSAFTQSRLKHYYPGEIAGKKMLMAPGAIDKRFFIAPEEKEIDGLRVKYNLPDTFYLVVGTMEPRKNLEYVLKAFSSLSEDMQKARPLVMVGKEGWGQKLPTDLENVTFTGYVEDEDLPKLYHLADALLFPSMYEGFGLPPLEAMAARTPVMAADIAPVREFASETIQYIALDNLDGLSSVLAVGPSRSMLEKAQEIARAYTWENTIRQIESCINEGK